MIFQTLFLLPVLVTLLRAFQVHGHIPAQPSNVTAQADGQASTSELHLQWYTNGTDWESVTRQSIGPNATDGPVQGIFVHFTENNAGSETTATPWIAFVSCDNTNSTITSSEPDIFTVARDRGAKSVILYSLYSETCVIRPGYQSSVLDVFTTQTLNASRRIEYEFGQFGPSSEAHYGYFNATMLDNAAEAIGDTIAFNYPAAPGFLFATLAAYNANNSGLQADTNETGSGASASSSGDDSQDTGVAMIILYAITGCVSALFCGVIVSGAIRAIRHPERYGPRPADPTLGGGQSRARGLGRAILDTFPVVKFGSSGNDRESGFSRPKDIESARLDTDSTIPPPPPPPDSVQLTQFSHAAEHDEHHNPREELVATTGQGAREDNQASEGTDQVDLSPRTFTVDHGSSRVPASSHDIVPECIGRETCPICIVDFEEGDDLRVLPCEGKHRFHQSCVDPWLLELSASCPICRQDFRALETIISGGPENEAPPPNRNSDSGASIQHSRRFSRYLRFALVRQRRASVGDQESPPPPES